LIFRRIARHHCAVAAPQIHRLKRRAFTAEEKTMRMTLACTFALLATTAVHAADVYVPAPAYGLAPPPPRYAAPVVIPAPPVVAYAPAPGLITVPGGPSYFVQQPAYQAGSEYVAGPLEVAGPGYYRQCWFEWGQRRCVIRPAWWQ
jgi:hypothetical protein